MKNLIKVFGIIAFVAIIGFSMAACDDGGGGGNDNNNNSGDPNKPIDPSKPDATFTSIDAFATWLRAQWRIPDCLLLCCLFLFFH